MRGTLFALIFRRGKGAEKSVDGRNEDRRVALRSRRQNVREGVRPRSILPPTPRLGRGCGQSREVPCLAGTRSVEEYVGLLLAFLI